MGSRFSRGRQNMNNNGEEGDGPYDQSQHRHLVAILNLLRSGHVQIVSPSLQSSPEEEVDDGEEEMGGKESNYALQPTEIPHKIPNAKKASSSTVEKCCHTNSKEINDLKMEILENTGRTLTSHNLSSLLTQREIGVDRGRAFTPGMRRNIASNYLPNTKITAATYRQKAFCGTFSREGNIFLTASQDQKIRVYDTSKDNFKLTKSIHARNMGWSVLDTAFSHDEQHLVYSSWSDSIHICRIVGDSETHTALQLNPRSYDSFCIFSLCFSMDDTEILGGANDCHLYVYDRDRDAQTLAIDAHDNDVNAVAFADDTSQILFSGGDDGLVKVWDRRALNERRPEPVGVLAGHTDGITFIDSKRDGRYLISNCKDQTIKLWDIRKFSSKEAQEATKKEVASHNWDYRWQPVPMRVSSQRRRVVGDTSLVTYRGHSVLHTLIRCRFSPQFTTGQRFIYSGCSKGRVFIYDVLTGEVVSELRGHTNCVRDVSWHPYEQRLHSTSWDFTIGQWQYKSPQELQEAHEASTGTSDDELANLLGVGLDNRILDNFR